MEANEVIDVVRERLILHAHAVSARESDATAQAAATRARVDVAAAQWSARVSQATARAVAVGQRHPSSASAALPATRSTMGWTNGTVAGGGSGSVTDSGSAAPFVSGLPGAIKTYFAAEHDFCCAFDQFVARQFAPGLTRLLVQAEGEGKPPGSVQPFTLTDATTDGTCRAYGRCFIFVLPLHWLCWWCRFVVVVVVVVAVAVAANHSWQLVSGLQA